MNRINNNRKINIYRTTSQSDDWKSFMSNIISSSWSNESRQANSNILNSEEFDVDASVDLLMDESIPVLSSDNDWNQPFASFINGLKGAGMMVEILNTGLNAVNTVVSGDSLNDLSTSSSFQPWVKNIESFNGTKSSGIGFNYKFNFALGQYGLWNAKEEVVKPILNLIAPALPQYLSATSISGPAPNAVNMVANMIYDIINETSKGEAKGLWDSITKHFKKMTGVLDFFNASANALTDIGNALQELILDGYKNYTYTVQFGKFITFEKMMIKDCKWNFSNEVDQNGFPISGWVDLTFKGSIPIALTTSADSNRAMRFNI